MFKFSSLVFLFLISVTCFGDEPDWFITIKNDRDWLPSLSKCPADVMPDNFVAIYYTKENCGQQPLTCHTKCKSGNVHACYALALHLQKLELGEDIYESLFLRSCKLGSLSGCTNRAAGIQKKFGIENKLQCTVATYSKVCNKGDPWACTIYAYHLTHGVGVKQDIDLALKSINKSCKYGIDDPACKNAMKLKAEIEQALKQTKSESNHKNID